MFGELVQCSWYSDSLQAGQSRVKILAGTRNFLISKTVQTSCGLTQAPIQWVPRLRMSGTVTLLSLCIFTAWAEITLLLAFIAVYVNSGFHCAV